MSEPKSHQGSSRRELRKALIRLRMEMHRQEIRHESAHLLQPLQRFRGMRSNWKGALGLPQSPLWGVGVAAILGMFGGRATKTRRSGKTSKVASLFKLGVTLLPLLKVAVQNRTRRP